MTKEEMRGELDSWLGYLSQNGAKLSPERFQEVATYIASLEREDEKVEKKDKDKFQKEVDDEAEEKKPNEPPKRMFATRDFNSFIEVMEQASLLRYSPPSGFSGLEPGGGHTAGLIYPGTDPLQSPSSEMWSETDGEPIGDGPEAHQADGGTAGGSNITLEVWPEGYCNLLVGGKPTGTATIGGMVTGGRSAATEPIKTRKNADDVELPVQPIRVDLTANDIRALILKADEGMEYRRQLELDGVRYVTARDQANANPDLHLRVMRSISDIKDLKRYVDDLRESAVEKYRTNPQVPKDIKDFLRLPERQTVAPATGVGNREFVQKQSRSDLLDDASLYKA